MACFSCANRNFSSVVGVRQTLQCVGRTHAPQRERMCEMNPFCMSGHSGSQGRQLWSPRVGNLPRNGLRGPERLQWAPFSSITCFISAVGGGFIFILGTRISSTTQ